MGGCSLTWAAPQLSEWWIQHSTLQSTQSCVGSSVGFFHHGFFIPSKATFGSSELSLQSLLWVSAHTIYRSPWVMEGRCPANCAGWWGFSSRRENGMHGAYSGEDGGVCFTTSRSWWFLMVVSPLGSWHAHVVSFFHWLESFVWNARPEWRLPDIELCWKYLWNCSGAFWSINILSCGILASPLWGGGNKNICQKIFPNGQSFCKHISRIEGGRGGNKKREPIFLS